jgi:hypothetical protein
MQLLMKLSVLIKQLQCNLHILSYQHAKEMSGHILVLGNVHPIPVELKGTMISDKRNKAQDLCMTFKFKSVICKK